MARVNGTKKSNKNIVIMEADKGGCVVIMNPNHYCQMIHQHLNDNTTYAKTDESCD